MFINDMPKLQHELCAAFVLSTVACARIQSVDPSAALVSLGLRSFCAKLKTMLALDRLTCVNIMTDILIC